MLLIAMDTPGVTVRPIELIDGGHEVNEVFFEDVRVPGREPRRRGEPGLDDREVPARQRARRRRAGRRHQAGAGPGQGARAASTADGRRCRRPAAWPARIAELENELLALELTALRVVAQLRRRQAAPGLVGAQAQGHRAAAGGQRAGRRPRRPAVAGLRAPTTAPTCPTGRGVADPDYLNSARPRSTAGPTRSSARSSPARSWDSEGDRHGLHLRRASRTPSARPSAACSARRTPTARTAAATVAEDDPGFDEKTWARLAEMGVLGLPFAEEDGGMGAGPVEVGDRRRGDRPGARARAVPDVGRAGRRPGRRRRHRGAEGRDARRRWPPGERVLAFAHAEPGTPLEPPAAAVTATAGRRRRGR